MRFNLTIKTIAAVIVSSMFAVSCSKTSFVPYVDSSMGFVTGDNLFTTDAGMTYDFTTAEQFDYEFGTRLFVSCEVGDCIDPAKNLFSANLVNCSVPVTGAIVRPGTSGFDKSEWKDPISVNNAWISGGYINLYCSWTGHKNSGVVQRSAFVFEGTSTGIDNAPDTLSFSLVHDSEGDGFSSGGDVTNLVMINKMATFPVQEFLPSGNAVIRLLWTWHRSDGHYIYPETESHSMIYDYSAAAASAEPSTKAIISPFTTLAP